MKTFFMRVLPVLVLGGAAVAQTLRMPTEVTGFSVPSYDEKNQMTSRMMGDFARILQDGNVEITKFNMEFYSRAGTNRVTEMYITSPKCMFNRTKGFANSEESVRISRDGMVVTGHGFTWDNKGQVLEIKKDAKVVLNDVRRNMKKGAQP